MLLETLTTTLEMAQTDIKDINTVAVKTLATSNTNFMQTAPGGLKVTTGRGCAGAPGGEVMIVGD